jgi:integrase
MTTKTLAVVSGPRHHRKRRRTAASATTVAPTTPDLLGGLVDMEKATGAPLLTPPPANARHRAQTGPIVRPVPLAVAPEVWLDARGHRRSAATMPGYGKGRTPKSKGQKYPRNPPTTGEMMRLLEGCAFTPQGRRLFYWVLFTWRTGLRIAESLALLPEDLDLDAGSITVRHGKNDMFRRCGMDQWGWGQFTPYLKMRRLYPPGPLFCVLEGPTAGRGWGASQVRYELHRHARACAIAKRITPHQLRHAFAEERKKEGMTIEELGVQIGHTDPKSTYRYIGRPTSTEVLEVMRRRQVPFVPMSDAMTPGGVTDGLQ